MRTIVECECDNTVVAKDKLGRKFLMRCPMFGLYAMDYYLDERCDKKCDLCKNGTMLIKSEI